MICSYSQNVDQDMTTGVQMDSISAVHDASGKAFVIVLSYNIGYHV